MCSAISYLLEMTWNAVIVAVQLWKNTRGSSNQRGMFAMTLYNIIYWLNPGDSLQIIITCINQEMFNLIEINRQDNFNSSWREEQSDNEDEEVHIAFAYKSLMIIE